MPTGPSTKPTGRPGAAALGANIHLRGTELDVRSRSLLRDKLARKLGKFSRSIARVSVRGEDVNGPRGGVDKVCRIKVVLKGLPSVVVEQRGTTLEVAMQVALASVERAVRRTIERRRTKPLTKRRGTTPTRG